MRMYDIIMKKRNGEELSEEEIRFFVNGYTKGEIPDYQVSALMMAIYFQKMTKQETLTLTLAMAESGEMLDLSDIPGIKVDKHSTGGVGDKTSLVLIPMVASCGLKVAKMSGRGLGHTGGTIDKLESFDGFVTGLSLEAFKKGVNAVGIALMGQTADLAPADKKLYALRDVTATVDNLSLIASSIMSKKLAAGADCIVLDVKTGSGAFMKKEEDAFALAKEMTDIGNMSGRKTIAVVTDMDQPLGNAVGNALEVKEAIETLKGRGPEDFVQVCMALGTQMLIAGNVAKNEEEARTMLKNSIESGAALQKLADFVQMQGGDERQVYSPELLPQAELQIPILADKEGYIKHIDCDEIGICSLLLGGGRETKEDTIDLSVGLVLKKKVGDFVRVGDTLAVLHANSKEKAGQATKRFNAAYHIGTEEWKKPAIIKGIVL